MQYGYFDDKNKEYVITRPDTPAFKKIQMRLEHYLKF